MPMPESRESDEQQKAAEAEVQKFRDELGPFVVAAEKTRMAMIFTNAKEPENSIVFANDAFLKLTGFERAEVLGASFKSLMTRGIGTGELADIEAAFAGRFDSEPEICYKRGDGTNFWASLFISPVCDKRGKVVQHFISIVDHTAQRDKQAHSEMLVDELNHRVKNTLSTIQSIVRQALLGRGDLASIRESIDSRIFALARSHDLLSQQQWDGAELRDLVAAALLPFRTADGPTERISIDGPDVRMTPKAALALGIAFHELATNAVKYGALSNDVGRISIGWNVGSMPEPGDLSIKWHESGGPRVDTPTHRGFGTQVIERGLSHEIHGNVQLRYLPSGLECDITIPAAKNIRRE